MAPNPFHPDVLDPFGKAVTAIKKGDLPGHVFHGNQYESGGGGSAPASTGGRHKEAIGHLQELQVRAENRSGKGMRQNTDVLGNRFIAAPYGSTISGHVALQNWRIAGEAKALADKIGGDQTKSVEQHLDEARNQVGQLRQEAVQNSRFDNYDTAKGLREQAAALQGVIDHVSDKLGIQKSVGEIAEWIAFAKGDTPGHPFHGNQYAQVAADHADEHREAAAMHMDKANALARAAGAHLQFDGDAQLAQSTLDKANAHEAAANAHLDAAKAWDGVRQSGDTASANAAQALSTKAYEATEGIQKSVGETR